MTIGNITLKSPWLLAPMAGFTDAVMRTLCEEQGAALTYTEMVSAKGLSYGNDKTSRLLELAPQEDQVVVQLFGHEPATLAPLDANRSASSSAASARGEDVWVTTTLGNSPASRPTMPSTSLSASTAQSSFGRLATSGSIARTAVRSTSTDCGL